MSPTNRSRFWSPRKVVLGGMAALMVAGAPVSALAATHSTAATPAQQRSDVLTPGDHRDAPRDVLTAGDHRDATRDVLTPGDHRDAPRDVLTAGDHVDRVN
jgi:hypothetical protein